jgi:hypothetical protein
MQRAINLCDSCIHLNRPRGWYEGRDGIPSCNAYPGGVPVDIWRGEDHRQPRPDDGGVQYIMKPGREDFLATYLDRKESEQHVSSALGD